MTTRATTAALALALAMTGCVPATRPAITPAATPFAPSGTASRVVLMSFDGLSADELSVRTTLPTFSRLERDGLFVPRVTPVTPSATAVAHVAIITGAPPNVTGIVANRFHRPGAPWDEVTEGFSADLDAETLVEAAHHAGKRVGSIAYPTIDFRNARRSADWGVPFAQPLTKPRLIHLTRANFHAEWVPPGWKPRQRRHASFSPVMKARVEWSVPGFAPQDVDFAAYDTTDDRVTNYDALYVETQSGEVKPDARGWFAVSTTTADGIYGSWSKVMRATPALDDVTIYWGSVSHATAFPEGFRQAVDAKLGFWPGPPDERSAAERQAGRDGIDAATFAEQNERLSAWLAGAAALGVGQMPFDLLLVYEPTLDEAAHQFMVRRDSQRNATPENRAAGESVIAAAFDASDRALATVGSLLDPRRDALVVTGDHGLAAADTEVRLGRLLADWGMSANWTVIAGGNVAHFYRTGPPETTTALLQHLQQSGFFEKVESRTATSHPNSGDVVVYAWPNVGLSPGTGEAVVKPSYYGQHGGIGSHHELQTALFAWGAGVRPGRRPELRQTQIARYVAKLLGIDAPKNAE